MAKRTTPRKRGRFVDEDALDVAEHTSESVDAFVHARYTEYTAYTIAERAIPSGEDGLMPVQRRSLWAMLQLGLSHTSAYLKHATIIGETMGRYHPHGDAGIYDADVRLASKSPCRLIQGSGNWGSYTATPAAMRYHEARTTALTDAVYMDPYYLRAVERVPNFDGSREEPVLLPAKLPMVLAIEQQGIATGAATSIPAFTLDSLKAVTRMALSGQTLTDSLLVKTLRFTSRWGGRMISKPDEVLALFRNGVGAIRWSCEYVIEGNTITVTGLPPQYNFDNKLSAIADYGGVVSAQNQADKTSPVRLVIVVKRGAETDAIIKRVVAKFLHTSITYRFNVVRRTVNTLEIPHTVQSEFVEHLPLRAVFEDWLEWRLQYLERRALLAEEAVLKARNARLVLLRTAIDHLDEIFRILRTPKIEKVPALSAALGVSEDDAREIWQMAVGRLDRLSETEVIAEQREILRLRKVIRHDICNLGASALRRSALWNKDEEPDAETEARTNHDAGETAPPQRRSARRQRSTHARQVERPSARPTRARRTRRAG